MVVLDTNVISELFKPAPDANVMAWVGAVPGDDLHTTTVTRGELMFGLCCMPSGWRRIDLLQKVTLLFEQKLAGHVVPYESVAAEAHATIAAARRAQGRPVEHPTR